MQDQRDDGKAAKRDSGARSVSFRTSLFRNLVTLILMLAVAILAVSIFASQRAVRTLCQDLVTRSVDRTETELHRFFEPVSTNLAIAAEWFQRGIANDADRDGMNKLFAPVLDRNPQISSINTGDADGAGFMLLKQEGEWLNRRVDRANNANGARWDRWASLDAADPEQWVEKLDYDPRTRPWYQLATAGPRKTPGEVHWTEPYIFFTTKDPGITASTRMRRADGSEAVVAFDILLNDITELSAKLDQSPRGFALITDAEGRLVGLPRDPRFATADARLEAFMKHPRELGVPLVVEASLQFRRHFGIAEGEAFSIEQGQAPENVPFRWRHDGMAWWTAVRPCVIGGGLPLWIAVTVPEDDFLHELKQSRKYYLALAAAAVALAAWVSVLLARRYSRPIQSLIRQSDRLTALNTERVGSETSDIEEIAKLHDAQERMRLALDSFARYVPSDVVRELLDKGEAAVIGGRHTPMSILFTDIAGFTSISEAMDPESLTRHMASYFDAMIGIIQEHGGTVDKLIGDAIVAFWGAPTADRHHARNAVTAALACKRRLAELDREWAAQGLPPLPTRFGISTGEVVVGNVGAPARLSYTALGDSVNLASRLEGANSFYGTSILVSAATVEAIANTESAEGSPAIVWRQVDKVAVKGRSQAELIFEPLGFDEELDPGQIEWAAQYEAALQACLDRRFTEALAILDDELGGAKPGDPSLERLIQSCRGYLENPPPDDWDGVSRFTSKS